MRKVIVNLAVSLDGFIEGPNGEYDWCLTDQDYGMPQFMNSVDAVFIGRKSYQLLLAHPEYYPDKKVYLFTDTLTEVKGDGEVITSDVFAESIERIRNEHGGNIWFYGGASLLSAFMQQGYIDELLLSVHPILLGKGKPLFEGLKERVGLTLLETIPYQSGLVQLRYAVH
ncbi:dihydrofolate reductase [Mucilaginibacter hurinus]|uniref:Dihydrofolate reductase n=1 Tax=Mucilaginibacter hurinus TaxID=2201324 RepID=A0A367GUH7_9SPHI|nr:dihydrofolate reductase family protein [Mucilaginibacter hurinus]RCH56725.1 dihydrofolate reductase [Mucilaginibacter hurinus]